MLRSRIHVLIFGFVLLGSAGPVLGQIGPARPTIPGGGAQLARPVITSLSHSARRVGWELSIHGRHFDRIIPRFVAGPRTLYVKFGSTSRDLRQAERPHFVSPTLIKVYVPQDARSDRCA